VSVHGAHITSAHRRGDELAVDPSSFQSKRVVVDEIALGFILIAVILNVQAGTYYHEIPELINVIDIVTALLLGSIVMVTFMFVLGQVDLQWDWFLSRRDLGYTLMASVAGFIIALALWQFVIAPATSSVFDLVKDLSVYNQRIFFAKVAIAEELLFMCVVFPYLAPRLKWGAYPFTCVAFAVLHFAVYGTQPSALWAVAMYRAVFLAQWRLSGNRLSIPMLTHIIINLSA